MTLGTRSKKKEIGTLLVHKKGTIQNTNVGWVRNKAESRLGTSKEDWGTKTIKLETITGTLTIEPRAS